MFRILIIEDEPLIRKLLKKLLQNQGYDVVEATSGEEGLTQIRLMQPALILCDWELPGVNGITVCRKVKTDPKLADTYFIMLTAHTSLAYQIEGLDSGADDFLSKPIKIDELSARVRAGLRVYQALQNQRQLTQKLRLQQQQLEAEMAEAADYVRSLLPQPLDGPVSITTQFLPSKHLGGDCFDYYWLDPDFLVVYLLDVSGHGLGSALVSVSVQNILRSQTLPRVNFYQPGHVLTALNEVFQMNQEYDRYFTIWYGVYNRPRRQFYYSSAGHPPALLISPTASDLRLQQLKTRGTPIGMFPDCKYSTQICRVEENSTLYVFSDGVYEIPQSDGNVWNLKGFIDLITHTHRTSPSVKVESILQQIQRTHGHQDFEDDCSLLQVQLP